MTATTNNNTTMSFTLKNTIHGITETFTVKGNKVVIKSNFKTEYLPSTGIMSVENARIYWKELLKNGWVRI